MDTFDKWFIRFMFATEIIFLLASMPHIATWFAHFDNPTDGPSTFYAYTIGYALAVAIDGVSFMLLMAIMRMNNTEKTNWLVMGGLILFMTFIVVFSWWVNWQYDLQFANNAFQKAETHTLFGLDNSALNPIMGGAFQVLLLAYTFIGKAVKGSKQPGMTDEQFEQEKRKIAREQELKKLKSNGQGMFASGKQALLGQGKTAEEKRAETLNAIIDFLRDARELLDPRNEQRAIYAVAQYLKINQKEVLPYLIAARSGIAKEEQDRLNRRDTDELKALNVDESSSNPGNETGEEIDPLAGLTGRDTVSLEVAATVLGCQEKHVVTLRGQGKLKHASKNDQLITVASLRQYLATRRTTNRVTSAMPAIKPEQLPAQEHKLGMVENMMFDAIKKATAAEQAELHQLASEKSLSEFTSVLQSRYPQYAGHITENRVSNVMKAMGVKELISA